MDQTKLCGTQSLHFQRPAYILSAASVAGKKEAEGPLGKKFDMVDEQDNLFGAKTWEEAEAHMQNRAAQQRAICRKKPVYWPSEKQD